MPRERGERGQYRTTVTPDDVLDVLAAVRGPVVTSADVADALDVTRETARRKLDSLTDDSRLDSRKTAGRVVYWRGEEDAESERER
jgi:predicted ArsR family transcriptional regulator